ncbi:epoxide hydrolase [Mycobacteriaceae bacterium 1482268.1]|nr:epoxide hydrolase [Mycobacteriaceae bacterium 1482268.1]
MREPEWIDVATPEVQLRALTWGPTDGPVALCLHGFPDTAYGWRKLAPLLVDAGWRVVAPFMRGYAPSSTARDDSYHVGALMDDALHVLDAAGPTGRDVVIGHDWGAQAAVGLAAMTDTPISSAVVMSFPPFASFQPWGRAPDPVRLAAQIPRQLLRSWYVVYFLLPFLPELSGFRVVRSLWRQWSPGYDENNDVPLVEAAIGAQENWRAALATYRDNFRFTTPPEQYAELHQWFLKPPAVPTLYLHGDDDGCVAPDYISWVERILPAESDAVVVEGAGHFLQLEQPDVVGRHIVDFIGRA